MKRRLIVTTLALAVLLLALGGWTFQILRRRPV